MAVLTATYETGVDTATIATTDAGSASAWNVRQMAVGATCTYSSTHAYGTLSGKFGKAATSANAYMAWTTSLGTITDHYGRVYIWMDAYDGVRITFGNFQVFGVANCSTLAINSTGVLEARNNAGTVVASTTASASLGQWVRIEWHFIHSTTVGFVEMKLFNSPDSGTPTETVTSAANKNFGANIDGASFGFTQAPSTSGLVFYLDNIVMNATSYPGPVVVPSTAYQPGFRFAFR